METYFDERVVWLSWVVSRLFLCHKLLLSALPVSLSLYFGRLIIFPCQAVIWSVRTSVFIRQVCRLRVNLFPSHELYFAPTTIFVLPVAIQTRSSPPKQIFLRRTYGHLRIAKTNISSQFISKIFDSTSQSMPHRTHYVFYKTFCFIQDQTPASLFIASRKINEMCIRELDGRVVQHAR